MATTPDAPKRGRGRPPKARGVPAFISGPDIAHEIGVTRDQLYRWVALGHFPPPFTRPGPYTRLWRRDHWDEYVRTGKFPREAWKVTR